MLCVKQIYKHRHLQIAIAVQKMVAFYFISIIVIKQCRPVSEVDFKYPIPTFTSDQNVIFSQGNSIEYIFGASAMICWPDSREVLKIQERTERKVYVINFVSYESIRDGIEM